MSAEIIPFPIESNVYHVRETARVLERRHGEAADRFWKLTCRRLYARLQIGGVSDAEITKQLVAFTDAVQLEMKRGANSDRQNTNPTGAA